MCNLMVSFFKEKSKNPEERQSRYERAGPIRLEQVDQSMSRAIRVEQIRYG